MIISNCKSRRFTGFLRLVDRLTTAPDSVAVAPDFVVVGPDFVVVVPDFVAVDVGLKIELLRFLHFVKCEAPGGSPLFQ